MSTGLVLSTLHAAALLDEEELHRYRAYTGALLKRYYRMAHEIGRMPKLLGREIFRARITYYRASTFEDSVIFVHDVESCLDRIRPLSRVLLAKIVLQDYSQDETARLLGCTERTVRRRFPLALDELSSQFLACGLLVEIPCQEADEDENGLSACKQVQ